MRIYLFFGIVTAILIFIDVYTIGNWQKFIKRRGSNPWYYRAMWIAAALFLILSIPVNFAKIGDPNPPYYIKVLSSIVFIWYLPKLPICLFLEIKDLIRLFIYVVKKSISFLKKSNKIEKQKLQKNTKLATLGWYLALIPFTIYIYSSTITITDFEVKEVEISLNKLPKNLDGLRIVQISDIHPPSFYTSAAFAEVRQIIESLSPDIIVITGDFVNSHPDELDIVYDDLRKLNAPYGVYGCIGNHDHYMSNKIHSILINRLEDAGVNLLINENITLEINGEKLQLVGVDNSSWRLNYADYDKAFHGLSVAYTTILLCHDPVQWQNEIKGKMNADITLSGHTHGGQVGFDIFGHELSPAAMVYNYWRGLYNENGQYLYVNVGLGSVGPPVRIGIVHPEITLIVLRKTSHL